MRDAGFDVSFRDCPAKGGTGGHPTLRPETEPQYAVLAWTVWNVTRHHSVEQWH
jgi:hypothetical protein